MRQAPHMMMGRDPATVESIDLKSGIVGRVWRFARPYRSRIFVFLAVVVAQAFLAVVPALLIERIINNALSSESDPSSDPGLLTLLAGTMIAVAVAVAVLSLIERWLSSTVGEGLIYDLRVALFDHVQRMPVAFFTRTQTGALISRLNNDVIGAQRALTQTLGSLVSNTVLVTVVLATMLTLEWRLTLAALALLPVFILPAKRVGRRISAITREGFDLDASMNATMTERFGVSGAMLVKLFGRHDAERDLFGARADSVRDMGVRTALYTRAFLIALTLVASVGTALIYLLGGRLTISGAIAVGTLVALGTLVTQIYPPLTQLSNARVDLMAAFVSFDRVFEVLDAPSTLTDRPGAVDLVEPRGRLDFDGVWFRYPTGAESAIASLETTLAPRADEDGDSWVLADLDLHVESGELVALVGPSGAGKSTLSNLVPRLWDVTEGAVRVDGHDVRDLTQDSLRAAIGVVNQDPHLFHETVADNLRYAAPDADDADLEAACRSAHIHDVIAALPDGYETLVGERGYRLSGGEKQRLAIARMLLKDPAMVILDEATSHLDTENEALVQRALAEALTGRTALVIAHRLSTITRADQIVVLDRGRVVERGQHAELIANKSLYADLYATLVGGPAGSRGPPAHVEASTPAFSD